MSPTLADLTVKDEVFSTSYTITRADLVRYAGASGDFNPIHWSESTATSVGLPNVIAHGMFTMALANRAVSEWLGDAGKMLDVSARFTKPVVVPDSEDVSVSFTGTVKSVDEAAKQATIMVAAKCAGQSVLGRALAVVAVP